MTRIHVRRDIIAKDKKLGQHSRALGIETTGKPKRYAKSVTIHGPSTIIYRPNRPLHCGARAWISTESNITLHN